MMSRLRDVSICMSTTGTRGRPLPKAPQVAPLSPLRYTPRSVDAKSVAGVAANPLDRIDLALGRTVAYVCGGVVNGRAGLADLLAVVAIFGLSAWAMVWVSRKIFSGAS